MDNSMHLGFLDCWAARRQLTRQQLIDMYHRQELNEDDMEVVGQVIKDMEGNNERQ